jgi:hypothetical protein
LNNNIIHMTTQTAGGDFELYKGLVRGLCKSPKIC